MTTTESPNTKISTSAVPVIIEKKISIKKESVNCSYIGNEEYTTEPKEDEETKGEKALWRAVITQALMDAGNNSSKPEMRYEKAQAISWLSGRSPDFYTVCSLADMEPDYIKRQAKEALTNGCIWREDEKFRERAKINEDLLKKRFQKKNPEIVNDNNMLYNEGQISKIEIVI